MWNKFRKFIESREGLIFILIGVVLLRLPSLMEPNRYADEDIYLTLGLAWKRGLVFYRDIHDNKPPLLYLMAGLSGSVAWFRALLLVWHLTSVAFFWAIMGKLANKRLWQIAMTALFVLFSSIPLTEGEISNGEMFMIMPTLAAVWLLLRKDGERLEIFKYLGAGILFALGFLFKVPVLFEMLGILFWLSLYQGKTWLEGLKRVFSLHIWIVVIGFLLPIVLSVIYYFNVGAGETYLRSALFQNIGYLSSWEGGRSIWQSELVWRGLIMLALMGLIYLKRARLGKEFGLAGLWLVTSLFGALLSGRPYPHYLIEIVAPMALLVGVTLDKLNWRRMTFALMLVGVVVFGINYYHFWYYKSLPYYKNYLEFVLGRKTKGEYFDYFGDKVRRNYQLAEYIRERTSREDLIYVWGTEPAVYVLAQRLPVGKYTVAYHVRDFDGFEQTLAAFDARPPEYVVWMEGEGEFAGLEKRLVNDYIQIKHFDGAQVWKRSNLPGIYSF